MALALAVLTTIVCRRKRDVEPIGVLGEDRLHNSVVMLSELGDGVRLGRHSGRT